MSDDELRVVMDVRHWPDDVVAALERASSGPWTWAVDTLVRRALDAELDARLKAAGPPMRMGR